MCVMTNSICGLPQYYFDAFLTYGGDVCAFKLHPSHTLRLTRKVTQRTRITCQILASSIESRDQIKMLKLYPDSENMNSYILTVVYWFQLKMILYNYSHIVGPNPSSTLNCGKTKTYYRRFIFTYFIYC